MTSPHLAASVASVQRKRGLQGSDISALLMAEQGMIYWLAQAAKEAREARGRKQVHVAAAMDTDQSTIYRFEQGKHWPRNADRIIAAYAEDLDIEERDLWKEALKLWAAQNSNRPR